VRKAREKRVGRAYRVVLVLVRINSMSDICAAVGGRLADAAALVQRFRLRRAAEEGAAIEAVSLMLAA
jgi:hypothetical protein